MHTQDLLVNTAANRHAIEDITEGLPELDVVAAFAIVVKPIDTCDTSTFVVSTQSEEVFLVLVLVAKQEQHDLKAALSAIHIIPEEAIV
jgi:hypothetical protein